jgi:hypothetical protein
MLDVHPLHRAPHTWSEFLLHIATISVGLLIAIGLEQSVEFVHRNHERNRLRNDLRIEGLINRERIDAAIQNLDAIQAWEVRATSAVRSTSDHSGRPQPYPGPYHVDPALLKRLRFTVPSATAWTVAGTSGAAALLPSAEAAGYTRLNYFRGLTLDSYEESIKTYTALTAAEAQASADLAARQPDLAALDRTQLDRLEAALTTDYTCIRTLKRSLLIFRDANDAVLDGIYDEDRMAQYLWERVVARDNAQAQTPSSGGSAATPTR